MTRSFLLLVWLSLRGRVVRSLRLLRQPKYAIGTAIGVAWILFWVGRPLVRMNFRPVGLAGLDGLTRGLEPTLQLIAALAVLIALTAPWLVPFGRLGLRFREAELTLLLQAPISRRQLIGYGLLKAAPGVMLTALVLGFLLAPGGAVERLRTFLGLWLLFAFWDLNSRWRAQFLLRQREIARRTAWLRRSALTAGLVALYAATAAAAVSYVGSVAAATRGAGFREAIAVLAATEPSVGLRAAAWPGRLLTAPLFANDWGRFAWTAAALLALIVAQRELVLRSPARFEESALRHAREQETRRSPTRRYGRSSTRSRRNAAFALLAVGRPELAVLWKNVMRVCRVPLWQIGVGSLLALVALAVLPVAFGVPPAFHYVIMITALPTTPFVVFMGGMVWHNDLRADLAHLELVRTWPVEPERFVLAQVLSPALLGFLAAAFGVGLSLASWFGEQLRVATSADGSALALFPVGDAALGVDANLAVVLGVVAVLPPLAGASFMSSALQNLAVMTAPAWLGRADAPRGIAAFGQRVVFSTGLFLAFALSLIPSAVLVLLAILLQHLVGLSWTAWALPVWGVLAALPTFLIGQLAILTTARAWRAMDASAEILEATD